MSKNKLGFESGPGRNTSILSEQAPGMFSVVTRAIKAVRQAMRAEHPYAIGVAETKQVFDSYSNYGTPATQQPEMSYANPYPQREQVSSRLGQASLTAAGDAPRTDFNNTDLVEESRAAVNRSYQPPMVAMPDYQAPPVSRSSVANISEAAATRAITNPGMQQEPMSNYYEVSQREATQ